MSKKFWGEIDVSKLTSPQLEQRVDLLEFTRGEVFLASVNNILRNDYGFVRAADEQIARDAQGNPLPLYTYPALEFLLQFDYRDKSVFEYGAGSSTFFWMQRAKRVVSVESDSTWFARLRPMLSANVELLMETSDGFPFALERYQERFDLIIIDGAGYRFDCAQVASTRLAPGGLIVLDNADWHPNSAKVLREAGLLQIDMSGFKPTEHHASTTSLFFDRAFAWQTLASKQPQHPCGGKRSHSAAWDRPYAVRPSK
jgi:predicted O-methyltransferase YrrM